MGKYFRITNILFFIVTVMMSCNTNKKLESDNKEIDSIEKKREELKQKFTQQQKENERKFDSLQLIEDSLKNKSNLSGFVDEAPIFNQTETK